MPHFELELVINSRTIFVKVHINIDVHEICVCRWQRVALHCHGHPGCGLGGNARSEDQIGWARRRLELTKRSSHGSEVWVGKGTEER